MHSLASTSTSTSTSPSVSGYFSRAFLSFISLHQRDFPFSIRLLKPRSSKATILAAAAAASDSLLPASFREKESFSDTDEDEDDEDDEDDDVAAEEYNDGLVAEVAGKYYDEEEADDAAGSSSTSFEDPVQLEEHKRQSVQRLVSEVKEYGEGILDYNEVAGIYDFPIDKFQRLAIQAFMQGSSVVVSAPTSSGKTLIAEAAAAATVARGRRLFYTTPLKALSNQKFRDFQKTFGEDNVGLLTGDSAVNKDAKVLIMTTEILRNMLYQSVGTVSSGSRLFDVDVVVLDEVHYLSDISRGTVWEEIVIYCPKEVQLICLSATVANADELAGWIGQIHGKTELVTSKKRPVPLTWHFSMKNSLLALLDEKGKRMNRKLSLDYIQTSSAELEPYVENRMKRHRGGKHHRRSSSITAISKHTSLSKNDKNSLRRSQVPLISDTLRQLREKSMLPAIWFIFSRRGCDAAVQYLENCKLLDECEVGEVELEVKRFRLKYPDAVRENALKGLLRGVAAHHAGCLPLWKSFIEELFQRGLVKVVFATETLAAGINMPARTAVISSLSKRAESGRVLLSSNELLQMAGRAGRRGIDEAGHAVLIQTPYEGAEECYELLFAGLEPLVSQFTASYGMVLNLLAGAKVTSQLMDPDGKKASRSGRTLEEARKLVEQSFGNYVGSNVMTAAREELTNTQREIKFLSCEVTDDAIDRKCQDQLSSEEYDEISYLQEQLRAEKKLRTGYRQIMELNRMSAWKPLLEEFESGHLPFICLQFKDGEAIQQIVPAVYVGKLSSFSAPKIITMVGLDSPVSTTNKTSSVSGQLHEQHCEPCYYVALGSDNSWYLFTEKWIKSLYKTGFPDVPLTNDDPLPREMLRKLLMKEDSEWKKLASSDFGPIWRMEGTLETWSWSLNVPVLSSLSDSNEVRYWSPAYQESLERYKEQRKKVSRLKKKIMSTKGFKQFKKIIDLTNFTKEKIQRLEARASRLIRRIEQIEPSGWKEFQQISKVIHETRALDIHTQVIYPLGETAAAIRGENELWLAMVLRNRLLLDLKPAQLAAICGSLVSDGIKIRPWKNNSYIYEPSSVVTTVVDLLDEPRGSLQHIQEKHGVKIPCGLDSQFSGMVEAWASGLTWREIMMDSAMDEGDLARLLRRTIDLLAQIPKLPDIDPALQKNALLASNVMDRAPINELAG